MKNKVVNQKKQFFSLYVYIKLQAQKKRTKIFIITWVFEQRENQNLMRDHGTEIKNLFRVSYCLLILHMTNSRSLWSPSLKFCVLHLNKNKTGAYKLW